MTDHESQSAKTNEQTAAEKQPATEETLKRIENSLIQLRGLVESARRDETYQTFSGALVVAVVLQLLVIALAGSAMIDWIFQGPPTSLYIKLSFAAFLQIGTLTAIVASQTGRIN